MEVPVKKSNTTPTCPKGQVSAKKISKKSTGDGRGAGLEQRRPTGNGQTGKMGNERRWQAQGQGQNLRSGECITMAELVKQFAIHAIVVIVKQSFKKTMWPGMVFINMRQRCMHTAQTMATMHDDVPQAQRLRPHQGQHQHPHAAGV
jgi:hypothetical protein